MSESKLLERVSHVIDTALGYGADAADAVIFDTMEDNVRVRMGKVEAIEQSASSALGLRVLCKGKQGYRQSIISTNDATPETVEQLVEQAVSMAKIAPEDPYIALADEALLAKEVPELSLIDKGGITPEKLQEQAMETEQYALAVDGVTNSDGAEASCSRSTVALMTSHGFAHSYQSGSYALSASVIAGTGQGMETDYAYTVARHYRDMEPARQVGQEAGERTVKRLKPQRMPSCQVPLVFEPRVARSLLRYFASAVNGAAVAKGTSFLKDKMGQKIFADTIRIIDDPLRPRGLGSEPFDAEGVQGTRRVMVEDGILQSWLLDVRSANQLGLTTTGHASRGLSSAPHPSSSNLYMEPGEASVEELLADIKDGLFVTGTFGMGVNDVTGDYSQGASGFRIENGKLTHPVSEVTIAGNLREMFRRASPANDLAFRYALNSPTLRVDGMTIAGS